MDNQQKEFGLLDIITIISFTIALMNLEENRKQTEDIRKILIEIQEHLDQQDGMLERR